MKTTNCPKSEDADASKSSKTLGSRYVNLRAFKLLPPKLCYGA